MALKKPSDFFNNKKDPLDEIKENYSVARPEKIEQVSEAFDVFKSNLDHIQSLSDFTSTFDSFKENLEKVENVSSEISSIKNEIKTLIKKEDLDSAMMAQLLFVDESITKIESRVSSINGKTVEKIKEDFANLSNSVESFLSIDAPKYKRLISESEVRVDGRFDTFKTNVEENLNTIRVDVGNEVTTALESIESVNENTINIVKAQFKETVRDVNKNVSELVEKELPKYNKLFAETEVRTEEKINEVIDSYKQDIEDLNAKVKLFTETEIPKYSNLLIETKLKSEKEVKDLEEEVLSKVNILSEKVQFISEGIPEKTSEKIQELKNITDEYKEEIESISKKYQSLYKDFKKREVSENKKLEKYSKDIEKYHKRFNFLEETVTEDLKEIQDVLVASNKSYHSSLKTESEEFRNKISDKMKGLEIDLVANEKHIKKQNDNIEDIREEIKGVFDKLQLNLLEEKNKELVDKINLIEEKISDFNEKKLLTEDNPTLPGDPSTDNSRDPLTPLNQKFATLDDLQNHYRTFINRIQQQIATIGGGGAGFIKDLDDVTFDQSTGENQLLIYNGSKWVGIASTALGGGSNVGAGGTWASNSIGISTTKNIGIGTTTAKSGVALFVAGDIEATNVNVAGTITYEDVKNVDSLGLSTFRSGIEVNTGSATTALLVRGDARIVGILTVGTASVTIDGDNNTVSVGIVTITNSEVILGDNVTLNASATGINSAPNVFYVAKDGLDTNNGTSIDNAKLTIASAVSIAQSGSVIKVLSGNYVESNPITLPAFVAVVGDDQRTVKVLPSNTTQDIFHVNKGCKLANMTFSGHLSPAAAVAFPTGIATNVGGGKWKGPYIQNCTSDTTTGTGIYIDGDKAEKTKSMNVDAFTQYNQGGVGVAVTNEGYAQLVSVFTICCDKAITVHKGGQADLANSNCSFGTFGLVANGLSDQQFIGTVTTSASSTQDNIIINVGSSTTRPYDGQVVYFDQLYKSVESISITNGGSGYTSTPSVTITSPTGPNGEVASAFALLKVV